jgi:hypothetical protein
MKRIFIGIMIVAALVVGGLNAQTKFEAAWKDNTTGQLNGRYWRVISKAEKWTFVEGYRDGITLVLAKVYNSSYESFKKAYEIFIPLLTAEEIASSLDRIYETPENRPIAIVNAMKAVCSRASGTTESEVQKEIEDLRRRAVE